MVLVNSFRGLGHWSLGSIFLGLDKGDSRMDKKQRVSRAYSEGPGKDTESTSFQQALLLLLTTLLKALFLLSCQRAAWPVKSVAAFRPRARLPKASVNQDK